MTGNINKTQDKRFSYADYQNWPNDERFELIDGVVYDMNAPMRTHQKIVTELTKQFAIFFTNKTCEVYVAPFDVRLPKKNSKDEKEIFDVVQPDLTVVCDPKKLDDKGCLGAPDMTIEVLSTSTSSRDHITKRALYERVGVKEYWLVDPDGRIVMVYKLINGSYQKPDVYSARAKITSELFPEFQIDLNSVFPPLPEGMVCRENDGIRTEIVERKPRKKSI